jgi:hypothetical protein
MHSTFGNSFNIRHSEMRHPGLVCYSNPCPPSHTSRGSGHIHIDCHQSQTILTALSLLGDPYLIVSCHVISYLILSHPVLSCLTRSYPVVSCLTQPYPVLPSLILYYYSVVSCIILYYLPYFIVLLSLSFCET